MMSRSYSSKLRDAQVDATRDRILDALVEVLAQGVDALSIPAVAKAAEVSVGAVYRHFRDKAGLLNGLIPHAVARTGTRFEDAPDDLEGLDRMVRTVFHHFDNIDDLLRAAFATGVGRDLRVERSSDRLEIMRDIFEGITEQLPSDQLDHIAKLSLILTTSDVYLQWADRLGMSPDEAADETMWALQAILKGITDE